jgi:putative SOS response-associated peptidase YedK
LKLVFCGVFRRVTGCRAARGYWSCKPAKWHWFSLKPVEDRPLFAFPGIYRQWKGPIKKDGPNVDLDEVFSFLTTLPNAQMRAREGRRRIARLR